MKYTPRKVYILEKDTYTELTYEEFCNLKATNKFYEDKLFIPVQGCLIETDQKNYSEFYREKERACYLKKLDRKNILLSIDAFDSDDNNGTDFVSIQDDDIAELVSDKIMLDKLKEYLLKLSSEELKLIEALFFEGLSERQWSAKTGIPQKTINDRKRRILKKLKNFFEN